MRIVHSASNPSLSYIDEYLLYANVQGNTASTYRSILTLFINNCRDITNVSSVLLYVEDLRQLNNDLTVSNKCSQIRAFLRYLDERSLVPNKCHVHLKVKSSYQGGLKDEIPKDKIEEMFNCIDRSTIMGKRDYALLRLYQSTGMRLSEPLNCNVRNMREEVVINDQTGDPERLWFLYFTQKGGKDAVVRLFPKTLAAILDYLEARGTYEMGDPLFCSHTNHKESLSRLGQRAVQFMLKKLYKKVGLVGSRYTCHSLRYTVGITVYRETGSEDKASQALRHRSKQTIVYYTANERNKIMAKNVINIEV